MEERVDGRQPSVAGPGRVVAFALDVLEERQHPRRVELFDLEFARFDVQPARREADQELEAVGVRRAGVRTRHPLVREMFTQEGGKMRSERGHEVYPRCSASPASAICPIKIGVACRYQYVS